MIKPKTGHCPKCEDGKEKPIISGLCNLHYWKHRAEVNEAKKKPKPPPKPIPKVSKKRTIENLKYKVLRIEFLGKKENKICPITGKPTTEIHHKAGRVGFADEWARNEGISLMLDTRHWIALSREGHRQVEESPEWAKENGYSINRLR